MLSRVRLFATPWTVARQAPLSKGFSRQEHWSGLPYFLGDLPDPGSRASLLPRQVYSLPLCCLGSPELQYWASCSVAGGILVLGSASPAVTRWTLNPRTIREVPVLQVSNWGLEACRQLEGKEDNLRYLYLLLQLEGKEDNLRYLYLLLLSAPHRTPRNKRKGQRRELALDDLHLAKS